MSYFAAIIVALGWLNPPSEPIRETVDLIELNHVISPDTGNECFLQILFWEWQPLFSRYEIIAWRIRKCELVYPVRLPSGLWQLTFHDGDKLRTIEALSACETFDTFDKEIDARSYLPQEQRRQLREAKHGHD